MGRRQPYPGVEIRDNAIRIAFQWQGKRRRETLNLSPTPANLKYAARLRKEIQDAIRLGVFDYARFFPDSKHAGLPLIQGIREDLQSRWGTHGANGVRATDQQRVASAS